MSGALPAQAQWVWKDASGHRVYSDRAPGPEVAPQNILKQPGGRPITEAPPPAAPTDAKPTAKVDPELEKRRKAAEQQEADKQKEAAAKLAKAKADNCVRARQALATLTSGRRMRTSNAAGEAEYMSDEAKTAEVSRTQQIMADDCAAAAPQ